MQILHDHVILDKDEALVNSLFNGLLAQELALQTQTPVNQVIKRLTEEANKQLDSMTKKQREQMLQAYVEFSNA